MDFLPNKKASLSNIDRSLDFISILKRARIIFLIVLLLILLSRQSRYVNNLALNIYLLLLRTIALRINKSIPIISFSKMSISTLLDLVTMLSILVKIASLNGVSIASKRKVS